MIIGIDGNEANTFPRVGIGEYAYQLLCYFSMHQSASVSFIIFLKENASSDLPKETAYWRYKVIKPKKLWTQFALPWYLYTHNEHISVFFSPSHYSPRFSPYPTVIALMDTSYLHYPELFKKKDLYQLTQWTKYSVKNASSIFTISNSSRDDIIKQYQVSPSKVIVTYPGMKQTKFSMKTAFKDIEAKYALTHPYILFVGTIQPRKNIARLIEAFSKLNKKEYASLELVIVGKKGWLYEEILEAPGKYGVEEKVKFLDFVSDKELGVLYENAQAFILPSLYEGFGLPVLEAMQHGCPVITSKVSSLPEAGGDAALYVDPTNVSDIVEKIEQVMNNKKVRDAMIKKGYQQVKKFSWEQTAKQTLAILQEVGNSNAK